MNNFCICENKLSKCGAFDMPEGVLVCGFHKAELVYYLSQIASVVHTCMVVEGADRYRVLEPALDIHYPDPAPMLDYLADVIAELADVANDTVFSPELLEFIRSVGYLGCQTSRSHLLSAAHHIELMADGGPLVEDTIRQYAVQKILVGERPVREGWVRFVGLQEIFLLAGRAFPLDLADDMPVDATPCIACGWRSALPDPSSHSGLPHRCLNQSCAYADAEAIRDRVRALIIPQGGYTLPYNGYR